MVDESSSDGRGPKDARQDRLKLALRQNLKRRKAQARERGQAQDKVHDEAQDKAQGPVEGQGHVTEPSSCDVETSLHGEVGKRGG